MKHKKACRETKGFLCRLKSPGVDQAVVVSLIISGRRPMNSSTSL